MKWLQNFMRGRYGTDQLNMFLLILAIVVMLLTSMLNIPYVFLVSIALLILCYYRLFSRKTYKRSGENTKFLRILYPFSSRWHSMRKKWKDRKVYKYYKCPSCKQELRVPKGKGEITITCPKCKTKFDKKT